ncbi:MAG TPA: hypothetical protein VFQ35_16515 [Polyangiaceae bacterium]|nr:hypothetical protein [Polyangiaceae bacterium]
MSLRSLSYISFGLTIAALGCSASSDAGTAEGETSGNVELAIERVPDDAACLRVAASAGRTVSKTFKLTAGASQTFSLDRLPLGVARVDAEVYPLSCEKVQASSVPNYVTDSSTLVRIDPLVPAQVVLKLIRNGRANVKVDFETPPWIDASRGPVELALIGDTPYGAAQIADFPAFIASIGNAPNLREVVHLGDIKNGSSRCDDSYFQFVLDNFESSAIPFVYTPGDNEWTDCHRANNGAYDPLERLATLRSMFFPTPGLSLGRAPRQVESQSFYPGFETFVENQLWVEAGAVFAAVHVVGSNNSLLAWYTDDRTGTKLDDPARRQAEVEARTRANLAWLDHAFSVATEQSAVGVVLLMQADMWDGSPTNGFDSTVQKIASQSLAFGKPVLLVEGDSHVFKADNPLAAGDPTHGVTTPVPNLTRIVVQGSTTAPLSEWLRLRVDPSQAQPFSFTRNPR